MAHTKFKCQVLTPEGEAFNGEVEMVSTRTGVGSLGILANHAPLMGMLEPTDARHKPYLPFDFVLYPDLTIYKIYNGYYFWGRASIQELRMDFRQISSEVRRDWDPYNLPEDVLERARQRAAELEQSNGH